jgi:sialidase-1
MQHHVWHFMRFIPLFLLAFGFLQAAEPLFETTRLFALTPKNKPNYRIPSIIAAPNGDILVICEKRNDGPGDIGNHDIVMKRSSDKGKTWSDEIVILDDENRVCTDLTVGLDRDTKKLWLLFLKDKKQYAYLTSTDNGLTWQGPVIIHDQVIKPEWQTNLPAIRRATPCSGRKAGCSAMAADRAMR